MSQPAQWKAKGRELQQKVRNFLCSTANGIFAPDTSCNLTPEIDVGSRIMGTAGEDVFCLTEKAKLLLGQLYVECKAEKQGVSPYRFMENHNTPEGRLLLLFHKRDRGKILVTMDLDSFWCFLTSYMKERRSLTP